MTATKYFRGDLMRTFSRVTLLSLLALGASVFLYTLIAQPISAGKEGRKWAVVVGIDKYKNEISELHCAVNDAKEFKKALVGTAGFKDDDVFLLTSEESGKRSPEKGYIVQWLSYVTGESAPGDTFVFFFSGHGIDMEHESYLLTMEANSFSADTLDATALKVSDLRKYLGNMKAGTILMFIDACRNDPRSGKGDKDNPLTSGFSKNLIIAGGKQSGGSAQFSATFFSCQVGQRSYEWKDKSMGFFTYYLVNGLKGGAKDSGGSVTVNSLERYLGHQVAEAVKREQGSKQEPWVSRSGASGGGDMAIAVPGNAAVTQPDAVAETAKPTVTVTVTPKATVTAIPKATVTVTATPKPTKTGGSDTAYVSTPRPTPAHTQVTGKKEAVNPKDGAEMVLVPAGEFLMGSPEGLGMVGEHPQHRVYLDSYYIYKYEVTNAQFAKFVSETGYDAGTVWKERYESEMDQHPVAWVSWNDANAYCRWAGGSLPTEAEWEKAARGTDGRQYPWGNKWDERACNWHNGPIMAGMAKVFSLGMRGATPVGSYPLGVSPYGAYDMAGNVDEWCSDWYDEMYYGSSPVKNPEGPGSGEYRVIRGGSFFDSNSNSLRCATRWGIDPNARDFFKGFRCCRSANTQ